MTGKQVSTVPAPPIDPARSETLQIKPRVAAFGSASDRATWAQALATETSVVTWFGSIAEALVDLRMGRFHIAFIASDAALARALKHTIAPPPVVVGNARLLPLFADSPEGAVVAAKPTEVGSAIRNLLKSRRARQADRAMQAVGTTPSTDS